jgi:hypothetical protein
MGMLSTSMNRNSELKSRTSRGIIMHSSTTAIEFVALVVRPRHVAALTEITQQAPIVAAFGKRARFVELGVCQYHQRFSDSTYRNAGAPRGCKPSFRVCSHSTRLIHRSRCCWRVPVLDLDPIRRALSDTADLGVWRRCEYHWPLAGVRLSEGLKKNC